MRFLRKIVPYVWGAVAVALLNLGWVALSRYTGDRRMERAAEERVARSGRVSIAPAGSALRIPWFYANSGEIIDGQHAVLCYGVENAASVRLEPPIEQLKPAFNRCFSVSPSQSTTYTLVAEGSDGSSERASLTVEVKPAPPYILFVSLSEKEIRRGQPWTMCYGVKHATAARLDPLGMKLPPVEKNCLRMFPVRTTQFTLLASDDLGRNDREKFTLTVR